jgi:hypothetical protein
MNEFPVFAPINCADELLELVPKLLMPLMPLKPLIPLIPLMPLMPLIPLMPLMPPIEEPVPVKLEPNEEPDLLVEPKLPFEPAGICPQDSNPYPAKTINKRAMDLNFMTSTPKNPRWDIAFRRFFLSTKHTANIKHRNRYYVSLLLYYRTSLQKTACCGKEGKNSVFQNFHLIRNHLHSDNNPQ